MGPTLSAGQQVIASHSPLASAASEKRPLSDDLRHRVALPIRRALGVVFVRVAVFVEDGAADELVHVRLRDHRSDAGRDNDAAYGSRLVDALDEMVANPAHVLVV